MASGPTDSSVPHGAFAVRLAYVLSVAAFLWICSGFFIAGKGFTYLVSFGDQESDRYLPALKAIDHYETVGSRGYDGQYYAQIAMHPDLGDKALAAAVDNLPYRARRILFSWTAWLIGLGDPVWALHVFSVQNIACWLALAMLTLRWFPPVDWQNFFRWAGVLFSFGLCVSVRSSLLDGPGLLLIAIGLALAEAGRPWWSAAVLALSGLGKETNILAAVAVVPSERRRLLSLRTAAQLALIALPVIAWIGALHFLVGDVLVAGPRNFQIPLSGYIGKWQEIFTQFGEPGLARPVRANILVLVALTTQLAFFVLYRRWQSPWWRLGVVYSGLMIFIGPAVWEGFPTAAARVLLPMTLAFNVLLPRARAWWVVLALGNLSVLATPEILRPPPSIEYEIAGPQELRVARENSGRFHLEFGDDWYGPERSIFERWTWSKGSADFVIANPHPFAVKAAATFTLRSTVDRTLILRADGRELWHGEAKAFADLSIALSDLSFAPGRTVWHFETPTPAAPPHNGDSRSLGFSLRELTFILLTAESPRDH